MLLEHRSKNKKILVIASLVFLAIGVLVLFYTPVIFQEGNPWPQIKGIAQLNFGDKEVVKLDIGENKYITKSNNPQIIKSFMKNKGYDFTEQLGSGYLFISDKGSAVTVHRYYSRFYSLWSITENKIIGEKISSKSLKEELEECLPKSDMGSHEKCNALLKQITDFDTCVKAGFSIMKSNPPQCATPDGQTFVEGKK